MPNEFDRDRTRPITERRRRRMIDVLERRQPDLTVVIEDVHDPHNVSAVLRSCEAVGIPVVHLVYTTEERPSLSRLSSASAVKWLDVRFHRDIDAAYAELRRQGFTIYATHFDPDAGDLYSLDLTGPVALVFGNEQRGVSEDARQGADGGLVIPMMGMVRSLNISVACAVSLYEALRQRRAAGGYLRPKLPPDQIDAQLRSWLEREHRTPD
ncbi:TrmH family RNA methyltransferase [Nitrolancea hollandica]|nr:RNA methyltransferase [Nitrolancea hollandica]